jgi:RNA polymerase sigma-70 factor, ECF subfamily
MNRLNKRMNSEIQSAIETVLPRKYEEDRELRERIAQGDERAFALLVGRFSVPVYRFLVRMVGSSEDAKDLTQDTFMAFHKHHRTLRTDVEIHPYLFTIARRKAVSFLRWRKIRNVLTPFQPEHDESLIGADRTPVESFEQSRKEAIVRECLEGLHPDKRAAVILRYFEGLTYSEIAQVMDKPEGTVKSLVYRSEEELRRRLARRLELGRGES